MPNKALNPEELLAHADFVRSLVRVLVSDEHERHDVVQETWLAALRSPPATHRSARSWLSRVIRNLVSNLKRGKYNRDVRERIAAIPEGLPSTDEIVTFEDERRRVVNALLKLDEPFRTALILRFYHDLPPREISRRTGAPIDTTQSRLKRGLSKLRNHLDAEYEGNRNRWISILAPLAGITVEQATASSTALAGASTLSAATGKTGTTLLSGGFSMTAKSKIVLATILLIGIVAVVSGVLFLKPVGSSYTSSSDDLLVSNSLENSEGSPGSTDDAIVSNSVPEVNRIELPTENFFIEGQVIDKITRQPVTAFHLNTKLQKKDENGVRRIINETIRDPEGQFRLPVDAGGTFLVMFHSSRHITTSWYHVDVPYEGGGTELLVELDPGRTVRGRVINDETEEPVEGALITFPPSSAYDTPLLWFLEGFPEYHPNSITGADGQFVLSGLNRRYLWAFHPDYSAAYAELSEEEPLFRLKKGFHIFGRVFDESGEPAEGIMVRISDYNWFSGRLGIPTLTDKNGYYRTPPTEPGVATLYAGPAGMEHYNPGPWPRHPQFTAEWKAVEIVDKDVELNFGISSDYVTWKGRLLDAQGKPIPSTHIIVELESPSLDHLLRRPETDAEGRFMLKKLLPGNYTLQVFGRDGRILHRWKSYYLGPPGELVRDLVIPDVSFRGVVIDPRTGQPAKGYGGNLTIDPFLYHEEIPKYAGIDNQGRFEVVGLPAGTYRLYASYSSVGHGTLDSLTLPRENPQEDVVIRLNPVGRLHFRLKGFEGCTAQEFEVRYQLEGEKRASYGYGKVSEWIGNEPIYERLPGGLRLTFFFSNLGVVEKECTIQPGETTLVTVNFSEIRRIDGRFCLNGTIQNADGSPLPDIEIMLCANKVPGWNSKESWIRTKANDEGIFSFGHLKIGEWWVRAKTKEGATYYFDNLYISPSSDQQLSLNLSLSTGAVTGFLRDGRTGLELGHDNGYWSVSLNSLETHTTTIRFGQKKGPCKFSLRGLRPGSYQMHAQAQGYGWTHSDTILVKDGKAIDIGAIDLNPNGSLELEVVNGDGRPITAHGVSSIVPPLALENRQYILEGRFRYNSLPIGLLKLKVTAEGFLDNEFTVNITPDKTAEKCVVLERE